MFIHIFILHIDRLIRKKSNVNIVKATYVKSHKPMPHNQLYFFLKNGYNIWIKC